MAARNDPPRLAPGVRVVARGRDRVQAGITLGREVTVAQGSAEAAVLDRGLEALDRAAGVRPVGYRAPMWETTYQTAELLLDRGFLYDSSLMDSDLPYELVKPGLRNGAAAHRPVLARSAPDRRRTIAPAGRCRRRAR